MGIADDLARLNAEYAPEYAHDDADDVAFDWSTLEPCGCPTEIVATEGHQAGCAVLVEFLDGFEPADPAK